MKTSSQHCQASSTGSVRRRAGVVDVPARRAAGSFFLSLLNFLSFFFHKKKRKKVEKRYIEKVKHFMKREEGETVSLLEKKHRDRSKDSVFWKIYARADFLCRKSSR